jgi:hypothetical protein
LFFLSFLFLSLSEPHRILIFIGFVLQPRNQIRLRRRRGRERGRGVCGVVVRISLGFSFRFLFFCRFYVRCRELEMRKSRRIYRPSLVVNRSKTSSRSLRICDGAYSQPLSRCLRTSLDWIRVVLCFPFFFTSAFPSP